ncbi:hypothetical protein [Streptomyces sp. NPDC056387]|uniref:hypothetical protein n=1 Tax=Streptomyces sp. NPDC056387 TaxID=3345803 RepID=UPI0035E2FAC7
MGKDYRGKNGARQLERDAREGMIVYYVTEHATNLAAQLEAQTWSALICTHYSRMWRAHMFGHYSVHAGRPLEAKGSIQAANVVLQLGSKYCSTTPPPGLRELASPERGCGFRPQIIGEMYDYEGATSFNHWDSPEMARKVDELAGWRRGRR